eukprot:2019617-Alexandrium_andersonii.AAC.1
MPNGPLKSLTSANGRGLARSPGGAVRSATPPRLSTVTGGVQLWADEARPRPQPRPAGRWHPAQSQPCV